MLLGSYRRLFLEGLPKIWLFFQVGCWNIFSSYNNNFKHGMNDWFILTTSFPLAGQIATVMAMASIIVIGATAATAAAAYLQVIQLPVVPGVPSAPVMSCANSAFFHFLQNNRWKNKITQLFSKLKYYDKKRAFFASKLRVDGSLSEWTPSYTEWSQPHFWRLYILFHVLLNVFCLKVNHRALKMVKWQSFFKAIIQA